MIIERLCLSEFLQLVLDNSAEQNTRYVYIDNCVRQPAGLLQH